MRAAPSFHSLSRAMISSSASAAPSRSPGAPSRLGQLEPRLMVVGVGGKPRLECAGIDVGRCARRDLERGLAPESIAACLAASAEIESSNAVASSACPSAISARASPPMTSALSGAIRENLAEDRDRARRIAFGEHLLAHLDQRLDLGFLGLRLALDRQLGEELVERLLDRLGRAVSGHVGDRLALEESVDGRDRLDLELGGDELVFFDIDLDQHHALVGIILGDLNRAPGPIACTARTIRPRNRGSPGSSSTAGRPRGRIWRSPRARPRSFPGSPRYCCSIRSVDPPYARPRLPPQAPLKADARFAQADRRAEPNSRCCEARSPMLGARLHPIGSLLVSIDAERA